MKTFLFLVLALVSFSESEAGKRRRTTTSYELGDDGVYHSYSDSDGNPISKAQYDADKADYNFKASLPSSWISSDGKVHWYQSELDAARRGSYGSTNRTTYNYGHTNYTQYNYGGSNGTIHNYGNSNTTIYNHGRGRTTVYDSPQSRTSVYGR